MVTADVARGFVVLDGDASSFGTLDMYAARHQLAEQLGMSPAQLGIVLYSGSVILRLSLHAANSHPLLTQLVELHMRGVLVTLVGRAVLAIIDADDIDVAAWRSRTAAPSLSLPPSLLIPTTASPVLATITLPPTAVPTLPPTPLPSTPAPTHTPTTVMPTLRPRTFYTELPTASRLSQTPTPAAPTLPPHSLYATLPPAYASSPVYVPTNLPPLFATAPPQPSYVIGHNNVATA